jgi:lipoprotein-anchoring transpeptidase ErfK/SrfK
VHARRQPITAYLSFFRKDLLSTTSVVAGAAFALMAGAVMPASGFTSGLLPVSAQSAGTQASAGRAAPLQRFAAANRNKEKEKAKDPSAELLAKAKDPFNIIISIDRQELTLYSGEHAIARSRVSTGTPGHATPQGVFSIIQKDRWHHSNIYGNAPMYYMQRITWSGVAMHEGVVPNTPASHGCIRLPGSFARQMWGTTKLGARVIVTGAPVSPEPIEHARLFKFTPKPEQPENPGPAEGAPMSSDEAKAAYAMQATDRPAADNPSGGPATPEAPKPAVAVKPLRPGPISVFISRKEGKLFVRKGFEPVFDVPVTFEQPDQPLGTHVFTALSFKDDNQTLRWMVVDVPTRVAVPAKKNEKGKKAAKAAPVEVSAPRKETAVGALERVSIPQEALDRIGELMSPGASLVISDKGLGPETGKGTDFIVLTR